MRQQANDLPITPNKRSSMLKGFNMSNSNEVRPHKPEEIPPTESAKAVNVLGVVPSKSFVYNR